MKGRTFLLMCAACVVWALYQPGSEAGTRQVRSDGSVWECTPLGCVMVSRPVQAQAAATATTVDCPCGDDCRCYAAGFAAGQAAMSSQAALSSEVCPICGQVHAPQVVQYSSQPVVRYSSQPVMMQYSSQPVMRSEPVVRGPLGFPRPLATWRARRLGL